jgi:hypothetical protein
MLRKELGSTEVEVQGVADVAPGSYKIEITTQFSSGKESRVPRPKPIGCSTLRA